MEMVQRNIEVHPEVWSKLKIEAMEMNKNVRELAGEILADYLESKKIKKEKKPKAIIIAAGVDTRLMPLTEDKPKCMLDVNGKTILQRQIEIFKQCGIDDVVVVRGYKKKSINYPGLRYYYNPNYRTNHVLGSLFSAETEMDDEFIAAYSDILFTASAVENLLKSAADICLCVDTGWQSRYVDRHQHPIEEAEKVVLQDGRVVKIGKSINPNEAHGEFVGLAKFSKTGAEIFQSNYKIAEKLFSNKPFHEAPVFRRAYFTDMIQELIDRGFVIDYVDVGGSWVEIDTHEDLQKAKKKFK